MCVCPCLVYSAVAVYSNALLYVSIFIANRFEAVFALQTGRTFTQATEGRTSLQDANPPERDVMGCREHEGWVLPQDASLCTGRIILCLRTDQEFTVGGQ